MPGERGFKYAYSAKHISDVLGKVSGAGRPDKLTFPYMRDTWLLKDAKYSAVLDLLRDMEFIDSAGAPTETYAEYQNSGLAKKSLAKSIKKAYPELFKAYPDANRQPKDFIKGYFKQKTGAEESVLNKMVATFEALCSIADFSDGAGESVDAAQHSRDGANPPLPNTTLVPITMNIQIVIPSDASAEQYDRIFSSIKKFLTKQE